MKTIPKAEMPLSNPIEQACRGGDIVTTHGSEPVERPAAMEDSKGDRTPGALRGKVHIAAEFFEPLPPEELEPWE